MSDQLQHDAKARKAIAPAIMERASTLAYRAPSVAIVRLRVPSATDGAAPKSPAKLFGLNKSPKIANNVTTVPPMRKRTRICA
jgi:hypothetical protein